MIAIGKDNEKRITELLVIVAGCYRSRLLVFLNLYGAKPLILCLKTHTGK